MKRLALALTVYAFAGCAAPAADFRAAPPIVAEHPDDFEEVRPCGVCPKEYRYRLHYQEVRKRWSRTVRASHDTWDTAVDASFTLFSPQYREAWVRMISGMRRMAPVTRVRFAEEQRADQEHFVELAVMMQAGRWDWNDLASSRSIWTITFIDDHGRVAPAFDVQALDFKQDELSVLFPDVTPFTRPFRVRFKPTFPDGTPLLRPDAGKVMIRMAGALASVDVVWEARPE